MRMFIRVKTRNEVLEQCRAQGVTVDQRQYERGSDFTTLSKGGCTVYWSSWNGIFFGTTPDGVEFMSDSDTHEQEPWFQQLLEFFYVSAGSTRGRLS